MKLIIDIISFPFKLVFGFVGFILKVTGKIIGAIIGIALIACGIALTVTIIGAPLGIPLIIAGIFMLIGCFF